MALPWWLHTCLLHLYWAIVGAAKGLHSVCTSICNCCRSRRDTSDSSRTHHHGHWSYMIDEDNDNVTTVLSQPQLHLYLAYRSSSSINLDSPNLYAAEHTTRNNISIVDDDDDDNAMTIDALRLLPEVIVDDQKSNLGGVDAKECTICLGEYESGDTIKWLPCMHNYHHQCLATWLRQKATCPLCKFPFHPPTD